MIGPAAWATRRGVRPRDHGRVDRQRHWIGSSGVLIDYRRGATLVPNRVNFLEAVSARSSAFRS